MRSHTTLSFLLLSLGLLSCSDRAVRADEGAEHTNTTLSEEEVEDFVTNDAIDLAAGSTMDSEPISTGEHTVDTTLTEEQVEEYITNASLNLDPGTTVGGSDIVTGSGVPAGAILMWTGSSIPDGWALCDGTNGTPDLGDRFVLGSGLSYAIGDVGGGESSITVSYQCVQESSCNAWSDPGVDVVSSVTASGALSPYYALAFIMKL